MQHEESPPDPQRVLGSEAVAPPPPDGGASASSAVSSLPGSIREKTVSPAIAIPSHPTEEEQEVVPAEIRSEVIRLFFAEHFTMNAIAESQGIHHDTVRRILNTKRFSLPRIERASQLDLYAGFMEKTVEEHPRIRATRLWAMLRARGFQGSVAIVRRRLALMRPRTSIHVPVSVLPGEQGQVDWAHFGKLDCGGHERNLYCFTCVLSWSRTLFARFCLSMDQAIFMRCHVEAFTYFSGIPRILLYDNLKNVVLERYKRDIRFNDDFLEFSSWYHFRADACAPRSGWQKGRVERAIRYIRDNFFTARRFRDLDDANRQLRDWLDHTANKRPWPDDRRRRVDEQWTEEKLRLLSLPETAPSTDQVLVRRSGKVPWLSFDCNLYSIPFEWTGRALTLRADEKRVRILDGDRLLADHERHYGRQEKVRIPEHFSRIEASRPRRETMTLQETLVAEIPEAEDLVRLMIEQHIAVGANCQRILRLLSIYPKDAVRQAICLAVARGIPRSPVVKSIVAHLTKTGPSVVSLPIDLPDRARVREVRVAAADLSAYDRLGHGSGNGEEK